MLARAPLALVALVVPPAVVAIGGLAAVSPKYALIAAGGAVLVAAMLANLTVGLACFTIVTFFNTLPSGAALDIAKPFGFVLTLSWLAALVKHGRRMPLLTRDNPMLTYLLFAFLAWSAISMAWAPNVGAAASSIVRLVLSVIFFFVVHSTVRTPRDLRVVAWSFVAGTALSTLYGFAFGLTVEGRFVGGSGDANFMASVLVASMVISAFLLATTRTVGARVLLLALLALDCAGLVRTQSRGGLIALAVALLASCVLAGRLRSRAIALTMVVVALGVGYYAVVAPAELRARTTNLSAQGSAGRSDLWGLAWRMVQDRPLEGVGLDNFQTVESNYVTRTFNILDVQRFRRLSLVTHNTYLQIWAELGTVGVALLLSIVVASIALAVQSLRRLAADRATDLLARSVTAGVIGLLAAYIFLSGQYEKQLWLLLGLLAAIPNVAASVEARDGTPAGAGPGA